MVIKVSVLRLHLVTAAVDPVSAALRDESQKR